MRRVALDGVDLLARPPLGGSPVAGVEVASSVSEWRARRFAIVCLGEAESPSPYRARGGAVEAALQLARHGLHVGLVASLDDEPSGRALLDQLRDAGIGVEGVALERPRTRILLSDARHSAPLRAEDEPPLTLPAGWSFELLLISGVAPGLIPLAAKCRAARAARRAGAPVVVDLNARRSAWRARDARQLYALLREADVVRASTDDLMSLWTDALTLRAAMRPTATFVLTDGASRASASGPFGELSLPPRALSPRSSPGAGDAFTAALCRELLSAGASVDWERAIRAGHAAAHAFLVDADSH